ncbi:hypothetical protein [Paenibacillus lemnae]|uniref:Uncharacterized protein n=1 Tax=Paenibacillus lemnae TaxID=1330551 RepID=A0A848M580_PAELE|nr:hypothetical protein [Paenibacillus lemnae]NMO96268.1 hypothetical protein [Paenibacillus lemnae]
MSVDRFIVKKLGSSQEVHTTLNLAKLFQIRIHKAQTAEEKRLNLPLLVNRR